jgi:hypothetical protein
VSRRVARPTFEGRDVDNWIAMGLQFAKRDLCAQAEECLAIAKRLAAAEVALMAGCAGELVDSAELVLR